MVLACKEPDQARHFYRETVGAPLAGADFHHDTRARRIHLLSGNSPSVSTTWTVSLPRTKSRPRSRHPVRGERRPLSAVEQPGGADLASSISRPMRLGKQKHEPSAFLLRRVPDDDVWRRSLFGNSVAVTPLPFLASERERAEPQWRSSHPSKVVGRCAVPPAALVLRAPPPRPAPERRRRLVEQLHPGGRGADADHSGDCGTRGAGRQAPGLSRVHGHERGGHGVFPNPPRRTHGCLTSGRGRHSVPVQH